MKEEKGKLVSIQAMKIVKWMESIQRREFKQSSSNILDYVCIRQSLTQWIWEKLEGHKYVAYDTYKFYASIDSTESSQRLAKMGLEPWTNLGLTTYEENKQGTSRVWEPQRFMLY